MGILKALQWRYEGVFRFSWARTSWESLYRIVYKIIHGAFCLIEKSFKGCVSAVDPWEAIGCIPILTFLASKGIVSLWRLLGGATFRPRTGGV